MRCAVVLVPRARETFTRVFLVVLVTPSEARGVTPFIPLRGRTRCAEAQCAGRAVACAHWLPQGGGKTSADWMQMRLRAACSPPHKSAGAARRPSRDASFSEACGADQYLHGSGKKSSSTNSPN